MNRLKRSADPWTRRTCKRSYNKSGILCERLDGGGWIVWTRKHYDEAVKDMNCALKLDRKIVGVKFLFDEDEFEGADAKKLSGKMAYCVHGQDCHDGQGV